MKIVNYNGSEQLAVFISEPGKIEKYCSMQLNVAFLQGNTLSIIQNSHQSSYLVTHLDNSLDSEDVIMIFSNGNIQKTFTFNSQSQTIVVTNKCNSNCIMCPYGEFVRKKAIIPNAVYLHDFVRYLPSHTKHLVITGGEPTLAQQGFFSMMLEIKKRFPDIQCLLLTNGRTFAIKNLTALAKETFPKDTLCAIPLYSANAEIHDSITQATGSFEQTRIGIHNLKELQFSIEIRVVISKLNFQEISKLAQFISDEFQNISVVNLMATEMCGNAAAHRSDVWIDYNVAFQSCIRAIETLIKHGINVGLYNFPLCSVAKAYWGLYKKSISEYKVRYAAICDTCKMKAFCGGVFQSSLSLASQSFKPFYEEI